MDKTTQPERRWPRWLLAGATTLLLLGGVQLTVSLMQQRGSRDVAKHQAAEWHARLALEFPAEEAAAWREAAAHDPLKLLRICAVETPESN
jgi:hypothetical protein